MIYHFINFFFFLPNNSLLTLLLTWLKDIFVKHVLQICIHAVKRIIAKLMDIIVARNYRIPIVNIIGQYLHLSTEIRES